MRTVLLFLLAGCGEPVAPPGSLVDDPAQPFPETMADVGLYPQGGRLDRPAAQAIPYAPVWPLWTNGSGKDRFIVLPEDTAVNTADWSFPDGTLLFKTFTYETPRGIEAVETRVLRLLGGDWSYATYQWDGREAALLEGTLPTPVAVELTDGTTFDHTIPATLQCRTCHEAGRGVVLGFTEVQLHGPDGRLVDPSLEGTALDGTVEAPRHVSHPDPATEEILGWLTGNCVHCHNGEGAASSAFDLSHEVALANLIDHPTEGSGSAAGVRVVPGDPERSVVYQAVSGESDDPDLATMPPLGVDVRDRAAIDRLYDWIVGLP